MINTGSADIGAVDIKIFYNDDELEVFDVLPGSEWPAGGEFGVALFAPTGFPLYFLICIVMNDVETTLETSRRRSYRSSGSAEFKRQRHIPLR